MTKVKKRNINNASGKNMGIIYQSDIQVYGIKRSGHHAILYWILGHYKNYSYYNNCAMRSRGGVAPYPEETFHSKPLQPNPMIFLSFEDKQENLHKSTIQFLGKHLHKPRMTRVLVIRDPFNNFASRFRLSHEFPDIYKQTRIWKELAREYLGITNFFGDNVIKINYNRWFKDIGYRKELSRNFGEFTDKNFNFVPGIGGGSSFDHRKYNGKSDKMQTHARWREYVNNKTFVNLIFKDKELMNLSSRIFGNIFKV